MRWKNTETPTFAGSNNTASQGPDVVETFELVDRDGNVVATFEKSVTGALSLEISGDLAVSGATTVADVGVVTQETPVVASADGAIAVKSGIVVITKGSAAALTLADPTATTDDYKILRIIAATAFAHTVSNAAGSGFNAGGAAADVGTFGGAKGDNIVLMAYQGDWFVISKVNVTLG